ASERAGWLLGPPGARPIEELSCTPAAGDPPRWITAGMLVTAAWAARLPFPATRPRGGAAAAGPGAGEPAAGVASVALMVTLRMLSCRFSCKRLGAPRRD